MDEIKDTTLRYLAMLKMIPRSPGAVETGLLLEKLKSQGFKVTTRTIQRDLVKLSVPFPLVTENMPGSRANLWSWAKEADPMDIPEMSPLAALTFTLVESFLGKMLPLTVMNYLNPHFKRAHNLLEKLHSTHFGRWHEKIRIIPRGQRLIPAPVNPDVLSVLYEALLREKQFEAEYLARDAIESKRYRVHPLGLVFRHEIIYLVCTIKEYHQIRHMPLHRFISARLTGDTRSIPALFDLDEVISRGEFSYPVKDAAIRLEVLFDKGAAAHLHETPLSKDQQLEETDENRVRLKATVQDTSELRWWLLGFGDKIEVSSPEKLREEFRGIAERMARMYQ